MHYDRLKTRVLAAVRSSPSGVALVILEKTTPGRRNTAKIAAVSPHRQQHCILSTSTRRRIHLPSLLTYKRKEFFDYELPEKNL